MRYRVEYVVDGDSRSVEVWAPDEMTALFLAGHYAHVASGDVDRVRVVAFSSS